MVAFLTIGAMLVFYSVAASLFSNWRQMAAFTVVMGLVSGFWRYSSALEMADRLQIRDPSLPAVVIGSLVVAILFGTAGWFVRGWIAGKSKE